MRSTRNGFAALHVLRREDGINSSREAAKAVKECNASLRMRACCKAKLEPKDQRSCAASAPGPPHRRSEKRQVHFYEIADDGRKGFQTRHDDQGSESCMTNASGASHRKRKTIPTSFSRENDGAEISTLKT